MVTRDVIRTHRTNVSAAVACISLLTTTVGLQAQEIRGRVISAADSTPIVQALLLLLNESGQERSRTVSGPSGGFQFSGLTAGRYRLRIQRIGQRGWEAPIFDLGAGHVTGMTLHVPDVPFELGELEAVARRPRCGVMLGDASLSARVLEAAQTALGLAEAEATSRRRIYVTESYSRTVPEQGLVRDSMLVRGELTGWPIQSADPDSLRIHGFVQGEWPSGRLPNPSAVVGPTYFAPDARVLFTDWFLASHCLRLETKTRRSGESETLVAKFEPAKGTRRAAGLKGELLFDRKTLNLRMLTFEFASRPSWAPRGTAGGEIRFAQLPDGGWVPASWQLRAPMPRAGSDRYHFYGTAVVGGRVTAVRGGDRRSDLKAEAALSRAMNF